MKKIYVAVIQAGGQGRRLKELTKDSIPKPMLILNGKPMLEWQISNLRKYGIRKVFIIIGHLGEKIKGYFGDGARLGVNIEYIEEREPLGSAGALYLLKGKNIGSNFFLIFGDVMFDIDMDRMERFHMYKQADVTLLVHPNSHPYDSDVVVIDEKQRVTGMLFKNGKRDFWYENCINAGIYILSKKLIDHMEKAEKLDFEKGLLVPYISSGKVYGYYTTEYVKDAGTVGRFLDTEIEFKKKIPQKRNLLYKQKCIFLDRDGTLNKYKGLLYSEKDFELEENAASAIRLINKSEYLAIVVSNQPVVARGLCSIQDVENIHKKMMTLLGNQGAYLDYIVYCPHHPDRGFPEENVKYKIKCNCRKPATGMIDEMVERYNIDVSASYMIGDTTLDIQTGVNAGLKTILVHTGVSGKDRKYNIKADIEVQDIQEAVEAILFEEKK